jgi:hypothetical protein
MWTGAADLVIVHGGADDRVPIRDALSPGGGRNGPRFEACRIVT